MAKRPSGEHLPGNDGRWYLELVGVIEPQPESTDTYATLERLTPPPVADDTETTGAVGLAVKGALVPGGGSDGEYVALGAPTGADDPADAPPSRRSVWLIAAALAAVVAVVIAGAIFVLPRAAEREAVATAAEHRAAMVTLRNELPSTQSALGDLTDPASNADAVSGVPVAIARLSSASGQAIGVATTPLPTTLPFVPRDRFDELGPTRSTMTILGATGRDVAGRLGVGYTYRTTAESLFAVGDLPTEAADGAITDLSIALAADLAETGRLVAELPPDSLFIEVRDRASTASQRYAIWQLEYLDALHEGDTGRAALLLAERQAAIDSLATSLAGALSALRNDLDPLIVELAAELEVAIAAVPG